MQSCVHSFFFCPTDRPTFTRGRAMGNKTFYGDGLIPCYCSSSNFYWKHVENIPNVSFPLPSRSSSFSLPIYLSLRFSDQKFKSVFSTYRVFFSEFLPSLFLKMLHRTVTEDQTRQKSVRVSVGQCKLTAYFSKNSTSNFDRGHFSYCRNYRKTDIQC